MQSLGLIYMYLEPGSFFILIRAWIPPQRLWPTTNMFATYKKHIVQLKENNEQLININAVNGHHIVSNDYTNLLYEIYLPLECLQQTQVLH